MRYSWRGLFKREEVTMGRSTLAWFGKMEAHEAEGTILSIPPSFRSTCSHGHTVRIQPVSGVEKLPLTATLPDMNIIVEGCPACIGKHPTNLGPGWKSTRSHNGEREAIPALLS